MKRVRLTITDADLAAFVDGETSLVPSSDLEAHLEETPEDRTKVEIWLRQKELLHLAFGRTAQEPVPLALSVIHPRSVKPELETVSLGEDPSQHASPNLSQSQGISKSVPSAGQSWVSGALWVCLSLGLIVLFKPELISEVSVLANHVGFFGSEPQKLDEISLQLAKRGSEAHRTFVAAKSLGVTGSLNLADDPSLSLALTRLVGVGVRVPDFKADGLRLIAARVTPGDLGPAAFLLFQSDMGEDFGLLISRIVGGEASYPVYRDDRGTSTLTWTSGQGGYVLTGQASSSRLLALRKASGF